jgi:hypothetical protein
MEFAVKYLLAVPLVLMLCACGTAPVSSSDTDASPSFGGSLPDAMHHRGFYLDHDDTPQWMKAAPRTNE